MKTQKIVGLMGLALTLGACGGGAEAAREEAAAAPVAAEAFGGAPAPAVPATGNVIDVRRVTDGANNYFEPAQITARRGDAIRYTLVSGLHSEYTFQCDPHAALGMVGTVTVE